MQQPVKNNAQITPYQRALGGAHPSGNKPVPPHPNAPSDYNGIRPASTPPPRPTNARRPYTAKTTSQHIKSALSSIPSRSGFDDLAIDRNSSRLLVMMAIAFLAFYILIAGAKLIGDHRSNQKAAIAEHVAQAEGTAAQIASKIDNFILWINNGISEGSSPSHSARLIAKSPGVRATLIVGLDGKIIAGYPQNATELKDVKIGKLGEGEVEINSLIKDDGTILPVIAIRRGRIVALATLANGELVRSSTPRGLVIGALMTPEGRIIDGGQSLGQSGAQSGFNLSEAKFDRMVTTVSRGAEFVKIGGRPYQVVSRPIPNSDSRLIYIDAQPKQALSYFSGSLAIFSILFIGTCAIIAALLNSLYRQIKSMREIQKETEISKQRFRAAIEGERGGVWELDLANDEAFISTSLAALLGLTRQEHCIPINQFLGLFHPADRQQFLSLARRTHIQGEIDFDIRVAHLPLILQCRGKQSTRSGREMKRVIVGVAVDITAQRTAQARLNAVENRLHSALSSMTDSFVVWDSMNRLVIWNKKFQDFFGFKDGQLSVGQDHTSVEYFANQAIVDTVYPQSQPQMQIFKLKDGRWLRYVQTNTADGGRVSIGTDITEIRTREFQLKENEQKLKNTVEVLKASQARIVELAERYANEKIRAEEASQSKSDFLASMSHELRTPLNAINGFSDIMQKEMFGPLGDPRYKEYVNDILFSGQHLLALINDILDMSKIEAGKMVLNSEIMFMHEMVEQVVRIVRGKAEEAQLNLVTDIEPVREIEADPRAVKQVLLNLMTNAIKFTPEGGTVSVSIHEKKTGLIISVSDTGIGISEENIERLAKPFEQVIDRNTKQKEGTGLGLVLSKSLVELHGGNFKINSELGVGTTVTFTLPNRPIKPKEVEPEQNDVSGEFSKLADDIADILSDDDDTRPNDEPSEYQYYQPKFNNTPSNGEAPDTSHPPPNSLPAA